MYPTNRIISAFTNPVDDAVVEAYAIEMKGNDIDTGHNGFPPILGYASTINEDDIENEDLFFMTGEQVTAEHLNQEVWYVTNGHHRTLAAIKAELNYIETEVDYNCLTTEAELLNYKKNEYGNAF